MRSIGSSKILKLTALLIISNLFALAQEKNLIPDVKRDSIRIAHSLTTLNAQTANNKDTSLVMHKWLSGKVLYCADGSLNATQLIAAPDTFITTIQYSYHGKILEQRFNYTDLANYKMDKIYHLPDKQPTYLFLLSKIEYQSDYEVDWLADFNKPSHALTDQDFKHITNITYIAVALRLVKDSLVEVHFPPYDPSPANTIDSANGVDTNDSTTTADTNSFGFRSYIKHPGKFIKPYLRYDTQKNTLSFLDVGCKECDGTNDAMQPVSSVDAGVFQYQNSGFVSVSDTAYFYPSLSELDKTVARQTYMAGKYIIKAKAVEGYAETYGGYIHATLTKEYRINAQTVAAYNNESWEKIDLKPDHHLQKNGSLIFLLQNEMNGYAPGPCGSGSYFESSFWLVDGKSSQLLFTISTSSCNANIDYTFKRNGEEIKDRFYVKDKDADRSFEGEQTSYWKSNSTYVFVLKDDEKGLSRNFYLTFDPTNKNNPVKVTTGKLYKTKKAVPLK